MPAKLKTTNNKVAHNFRDWFRFGYGHKPFTHPNKRKKKTSKNRQGVGSEPTARVLYS